MSSYFSPHYSHKWKFFYIIACVWHADYFFFLYPCSRSSPISGTFYTFCPFAPSPTQTCQVKCMHIFSHFKFRSCLLAHFALSAPVTQTPGFSGLLLYSQHHLTKPDLYLDFYTWLSISSSSRFYVLWRKGVMSSAFSSSETKHTIDARYILLILVVAGWVRNCKPNT